MNINNIHKTFLGGCVLSLLLAAGPAFADSGSIKILKDSLMGAGVGAISAEASGGEAGSGALIGAGTQVIGGALFNLLTEGPTQNQPDYYSGSVPTYTYTVPQPQPQPQPRPVQVQTVYSYPTEPVYVQQPQPVYYSYGPQEDPSRKIIKQGLLGAGIGAISSYASGGKGGRGALIGAGTNVIGSALLELLVSK